MSQDRKSMKVISLLCILWGLFSAIFTLLVIIEASSNGWTALSGAFAVGTFVQTVLGIYVASAGVKGANTPSKALPFMLSSIAFGLLEVLFLIAVFLLFQVEDPSALFAGWWGLVLAVLAAILGFRGSFVGRRVYRASLK